MAYDHKTDPKKLDIICKEELIKKENEGDLDLKRALLRNPNTPAKYLFELSFIGPNQVLVDELAANPNISHEILYKIYSGELPKAKNEIRPTKVPKAKKLKIYKALASNPSCPEDLMFNLINLNDAEILEILSENPSASEYILNYLFDFQNETIRSKIAKNPSAPNRVYQLLSNGTMLEKEIVASCPFTPDSILHNLVGDPNKHVRDKLAFNPNTSMESLLVLSDDSEPIVRQSVAKNQKISLELLKKMLTVETDISTRDVIINEINKREDAQIISFIKKSAININNYEDLSIQDKIKLIISRNTSLDILKKLAVDPNYEVRFSLACNKNIPPEILMLLTESKENRILECLLTNNNSNKDIKIISQIKIETNSNNITSIEKEGNNFSSNKEIYDPELESLYDEGRNNLKRKIYTDAILYFTKVIELCPNHDRAYASRAEAHMEEKKYIDAINDINMALNHDPENIVYEQKKQSWMMMERLKRLGRIK